MSRSLGRRAKQEAALQPMPSALHTCMREFRRQGHEKVSVGRAQPSFDEAQQVQLFDDREKPEPSEEAARLNEEATLAAKNGDPAKGEALLLGALKRFRRAGREQTLDTALTLRNLGALYYVQGNYVKAESYYKRALAVREKVVGREHAATGRSYSDLGSTYREQRKPKKAEEMFRRALAILEKAKGRKHIETVDVRYKLQFLLEDREWIERPPRDSRDTNRAIPTFQ
jgi:tetratricopeptide (TPR) repeat protein